MTFEKKDMEQVRDAISDEWEPAHQISEKLENIDSKMISQYLYILNENNEITRRECKGYEYKLGPNIKAPTVETVGFVASSYQWMP